MNLILNHSVIPNPEPEEAGTITVKAVVFGSAFTAPSTAINDFIEKDDECLCKVNLNYFLMELGMNNDDIPKAMLDLVLYVCDVTSSPSYTNSPGYALKVWLRVPLPSPEIDYDKIKYTGEECNNGGRVLTLPCGHKFNEKCVCKWFETIQLPCEDQ